MEVNKDEAERCRDMGAAALTKGDYARAIKLLNKSLSMYPLPGVEALLQHAKAQRDEETTSQQQRSSSSSHNNNGSSSRSSATSRAAPRRSNSTASATSVSSTGADGRSYTEEHVKIVRTVLRAKEGGRGAHYRVLGIRQDAAEADIKKAYRKLSLKVHPDKNSAPHADEAFKAVGLAYATLSDTQKRTIYDRYGDEDPDHRGGGRRPGAGGMHMRPGQEVSPEEIFNMFFGGGMPGMRAGGPGFHVYTNGGFGQGAQFRGGGRPRARQAPRPRQDEGPSLGAFVQFLPLLIIMLVSFFRSSDYEAAHASMPGEGRYFSLKYQKPFTNPLATRLSPVKDIPFYVSDKFLRTYARDRHQLGQVERMVERAYEQYLVKECKSQVAYKQRLERLAKQETDPEEAARKLKTAHEFEPSRCLELEDLFPKHRDKQGHANTKR